MLTRRELLRRMAQAGAAMAVWPSSAAVPAARAGVVVNDVHSQLNTTTVHEIVRPESVEAVQRIVRQAAKAGRAVSIAGGRHAMGGQQFGADTTLVDTRALDRVVEFDHEHGVIEVEAGIQWPALIDYLIRNQQGRDSQWGIIQKQTGADRLCIGGTLAANAHGRGLKLRPFVGDVESLTLVDAAGEIRRCSRRENAELFRLAIGGYGLFGTVTSVRLRLAPRRKLQRVVQVIDVDELMPAFEKRISDGFLFGDFQYATNIESPEFLQKGVFSCYRPVDSNTPIPEQQKELTEEDWKELLYLAHAAKSKAFESYSKHYLATNDQIYWSDTHQLSTYIDDYHQALTRRLHRTDKATEMITEIYVQRESLPRFLADARKEFRENQVDVIYGTVRLIEKDEESFLAWARDSFVCVIFNLHTDHTADGLERASQAFRRLIDLGVRHGGSYYLTYHRWATRRQVERSYPQFVDFLRLKRKYDPEERFQSEWYRHYRKMFSDLL